MIIHHGTIIRSINQDPLSTRAINIPMALENLGAATRRAGLPARVGVRPGDGRGATHADRVLLAWGGLGGLIAAADTRAEEEVVVRRAVVDEGPLHGVAARGVVGNLTGGAGDGTWGAVHLGDIDFGWDERQRSLIVYRRGPRWGK